MSQLGDLHVKRDKLSDQVANKIQTIILTGNLLPGEQLPPERVLGEQLGVSRTVVREAFRLLQERGLVRVVTGSGTYVTQADPRVVSQSIGVLLSRQENGFQDLIEIRLFLEVEIAALAAQRANDEHIEEMQIAIGRMQEAFIKIKPDSDGLEQFVQADLAFHHILAESTGNTLFPILLTSIVDLLRDFRRKASSMKGAPEAAISFHQEILECVRRHDPERARQVMREHMAHAEEVVAKLELDGNRTVQNLPVRSEG